MKLSLAPSIVAAATRELTFRNNKFKPFGAAPVVGGIEAALGGAGGLYNRIVWTVTDLHYVNLRRPARGKEAEAEVLELELLVTFPGGKYNSRANMSMAHTAALWDLYPLMGIVIPLPGSMPVGSRRGLVVWMVVSRLAKTPEQIHSYFVAAREPLLPALAYQVRITTEYPGVRPVPFKDSKGQTRVVIGGATDGMRFESSDSLARLGGLALVDANVAGIREAQPDLAADDLRALYEGITADGTALLFDDSDPLLDLEAILPRTGTVHLTTADRGRARSLARDGELVILED